MALDEALRLLATPDATTVLIDGRSGSGKTELAKQLCREWPASVVVRLDDIYPGWDGLLWAAEHIRSSLLEPRAAGRPGRWRSWDWTADCAAAWYTVEPGQRLIVEGIGSLTPATRALANLGIWVDADDHERKERALRRDGETYRPHWDRWAVQEVEFINRFDPRASADLFAMLTPGGFSLTSAEAGR